MMYFRLEEIETPQAHDDLIEALILLGILEEGPTNPV